MKEKFLILCCIFFATVCTIKAQVSIGAGEIPEKYATLQIKDKTGTSLDAVTSEKGGLLLPRVELKKKKELLPFATDAEVAANEQAYQDAKLSHTGLIVYNLLEDDDEELCKGVNQWDGEQWNCLQNKMGNAKFDPVDCSNIIPSGTYVEGTAVTAANYLTIKLNVTKVGAYAITATTTNGYNFYLSGIALSVGPLIVDVPCQGTPVNVQVDKLTVSGITLVSGCEPEIEVVSSVAEYSINCSSIVVGGLYRKGTVLNSTNTITLTVTVSTAGSYTINTPLTNGIRFSASGNFTVGTQTVTLTGTGDPTVNLDFPITINTNTQKGNNTCNTTIPVIMPAMTYAVIGTTSTYAWNSPSRTNALTSSNAFAPNGIVKIDGLKSMWQTDNLTTAAGYLNNGFTGTVIGTAYTNAKPDIVLYFAYGADPNAAITSALVTYINNGGCVVYGSADNTAAAVNVMMGGLFSLPASASAQIAGTATSDNVYPIANDPNDPIINGPFGNMAGRYWGEDNNSTGSVVITAMPANSKQVCSAYTPYGKASVDPEYSIVWYNDSKNFVYFGDSTGSDTNNTSTGAYPSSFTNTGLPQSKFYGYNAANSQYIYNAALELNSVTWCLKKAAVSGINPH